MDGKIILNQNNNFCEINELSNEKDQENGSQKLKKISLYLDYDVRNELVQESMENPCLKDISYKDIFNKINEKMFTKFKDISNHQNENYKNATKYLSNILMKQAKNRQKNIFALFFN